MFISCFNNSDGIRTRTHWVLRRRNTCATVCAKKTAENVLTFFIQMQYARRICEPVRDTADLWSKCGDRVDFSAYYEQCIDDVCSVNALDVTTPACVIMAVVARDCALQGAVLNKWSNHPSIDGKCGIYLHI